MPTPFEVHLPIGHPLVEPFCKSYLGNRQPVAVPVTGGGQPGQCYRNVEARIAQAGGDRQYGYMLLMWPNRFVEALHHSVWRRPLGDFEDLTGPPVPTFRSDTITFVPAEMVADVDKFQPVFPSIFQVLDGNRETEEFARFTRERVQQMRHDRRLFVNSKSLKYNTVTGQISGGTPVERDQLQTNSWRIRELTGLRDQAYIRLLQKEKQHDPAADGSCSCGSGLLHAACHALLPLALA